MHRHSMNRFWILLLTTCLFVGTGVATFTTAQAAGGSQQTDDMGSGDRGTDFSPPTATGDPDIPINSGLTAPRPRPGTRGETAGRLGSQAVANVPLTAREVWGIRFQVMFRTWLAMVVR